MTTPGSFNVEYINGVWTEDTIDANNSPTAGGTIASINLTAADENQYILLDVTSAVETWLSGDIANNGFALAAANASLNAMFDSKENTGTSHSPELDITYASSNGTITGVTTASGSGLSGGGNNGTLSLGLSRACARNEVLKWSGSAWACSSVSTGTITGVAAGTGLTGGGTSGKVSLDLNMSLLNKIYPQLGANNVYLGSQVVNGTFAVNNGASQSPKPALAVATGINGHTLTLYPSLGAQDFNNIVQAGDEALIFSNGALETGALVIAPWADAISGLRMNGKGQVFIGESKSGGGDPGFQMEVRGDARPDCCGRRRFWLVDAEGCIGRSRRQGVIPSGAWRLDRRAWRAAPGYSWRRKGHR